MWIEENEKILFVSAVERRERELLQEMNENRRVCNEYVVQVRSRFAGSKDLAHELLCPITHQVMVDAVIAPDGHTYERAAIERGFESTRQGDNFRSPVTGLMLSSRLLTPNVAFRSMCMDYVEDTSS